MAYTPAEIVNKSAKYSEMLNKGIDPMEELDRVKKELAQIKAIEATNIEKKLSETEDGKALIAARDAKMKELMIEFLAREPSTSYRANNIISNFNEEAKRILNV